MLRELVIWVLNTYLGKYLENFNSKQLTLGLLSGEVELENVPLRRDALRHLGLPLQVQQGTIGKIKLQVPIRQFRTAPWCIILEKIHIVIAPIALNDWDAEKEDEAYFNYKLMELSNIEAKWRAQREANIENNYYASSYSGWLSYGTGVMTNIIENLQLKINDVHIRYEDSITVPNVYFAFGLILDSLTAQSCDSNWDPKATNTQNIASFKLVELKSFSVYWDQLEKGATPTKNEAESLENISKKFLSTNKHCYVVYPISGQARLKQDRSETPLRTRSRPRFFCEVIVNEVNFSLSDLQYSQIVECFRGIDDLARIRRYRLYRPRCKIKEKACLWWRYAARCHGYNHQSPEQKRLIGRENIRYLKLCMKLIINPNENLIPDDKDFKTEFEIKRELEDLKALRRISLLCVPDDDKSQGQRDNRGREMLFQWFPQWWGWYGNKTPTNTSTESEIGQEVSTSDASVDLDQVTFEDDLLNALAAGPADNNSLLKRDAVFGRFEFVLRNGMLNVCSANMVTNEITTMMEMHFITLMLSIEARPRSGSHLVSLSLGSIRVKDRITADTEFPELIKAQVKESMAASTYHFASQKTKESARNEVEGCSDPLFYLQYERKPLAYNADYRLVVKTRPLDVVYNPGALRWLVDFITKPVQMLSAKQRIEAMKTRTKLKLIKNCKNILDGDLRQRKSWSLEIDICAPQIIFAENLSNRSTSIVLIDFGRFQLLKNSTQNFMRQQKNHENSSLLNNKSIVKLHYLDSEDEDAFMTPCSTPPGSEESTTTSPTLCSAIQDISEDEVKPIFSGCSYGAGNGLESALYDKMYDKYTIDLTDLQMLVFKGKDRWGNASTKGTSSLHVLDRFNISLQLERRVVNTVDPQYPAVTLFGTLPRLVVHVNEYKISALTHFLDILSENSAPSSFRSPNSSPDLEQTEFLIDDTSTEETLHSQQDSAISNLIILQFVIDQMSLEVQSRGRSIVELQVTGVRAGFNKRLLETTISLSVHGLLLADAIQSYGQDFELLVASHRHVGIDSVSGSLKQSEPSSPMSPGSPDCYQDRRPTSPQTITKAIGDLQKENWSSLDDLDALITIEMIFITADDIGEKLQIANIQFNNLDIIANQETIVELMDFIKRIFPSTVRPNKSATNLKENDELSKRTEASTVAKETEEDGQNVIRTEINFDFHRLNVLILRALMRDTYLVGRKVGTFTMSEARIHATLGPETTVEGSLGGLQVLDLTPEGVNHQRILSIGKDPLTELPAIKRDLLSSLTEEVYGTINQTKDEVIQTKALSFKISKDLRALITIKIRMASVWYTHCARFMQELSWCATEFKHNLKNLARSIREKATNMAFGLVQIQDRDGFGISPDNSPFNRETNDVYLNFTLKKKRRSKKHQVSLDMVLDTPVVVMPRSSSSPQVLVAHLGKITITNRTAISRQQDSVEEREMFTINEEQIPIVTFNDFQMDEEIELAAAEQALKQSIDYGEDGQPVADTYSIDVRNMNIFSLDTSKRKDCRISALPRAEEFYSCKSDSVAILHDTAIRLKISKTLENAGQTAEGVALFKDILNVNGSVTQPLQLSLSRQQYEQLLETVDNIFKVPNDLVQPPVDMKLCRTAAAGQVQNDEDMSPGFDLGSINYAEASYYSGTTANDIEKRKYMEPKIQFELPTFIIQLKDTQNTPLIEISFREFTVNYDKNTLYETGLQISLQSILMEDLLCPIDSRHRQMVISSSSENQASRVNSSISSSCPNLTKFHFRDDTITGSLPEHLEAYAVFEKLPHQPPHLITPKPVHSATDSSHTPLYPETPPPSPQPRMKENNLVIYSALIVDPSCPDFSTQYNSLRQTSSIDFNCLDLIISVDRWFVLLDFFGLMSDDDAEINHSKEEKSIPTQSKDHMEGNTELDIKIRSLNLVLVRKASEIAKTNISNASFLISKQHNAKTVKGRLGSVSLFDLTPYGGIYRERFLTSGTEALKFLYKRENEKNNRRTLNKDAKLTVQMSSVRYVHTKRFVMEIQEFIKEFLQIQTPVMRKLTSSDSRFYLQQRPTQLGLEINAGSPIILLPSSYQSNEVIVADLGQFSLKNNFHLASEQDVISIKKDTTLLDEILDVMHIDLVNTDLFAGSRWSKCNEDINAENCPNICLDMGSYWIIRQGDSMLKDKCHLKLQIERNMDSWKSHNCPDFSVQGTLSRLEVILDIDQYKLVRGFLSYNLGEPIDDIYTTNLSFPESRLNLNAVEDEKSHERYSWTSMSINLDLENVSMLLLWSTGGQPLESKIEGSAQTMLACINFIKSSLKIDTYSDGSQDIDLISQEILVRDSRFHKDPAPKNVFHNILQPIDIRPGRNLVQAEVHSRKRNDHTKFTVLLNNMRLMAILDWLENMKDFLSQNAEQPKGMLLSQPSSATTASTNNDAALAAALAASEGVPMELIFNITDSELVFVEKTNQIDTNAIILKSTTVLTFNSLKIEKPISINLNNLELFSCILGFEEESALSIIDPITINADIRNHILQIQLQKQFCIRLSYHDVMMIVRMLQSLPKQTRTAQKNDNDSDSDEDGYRILLGKLCALGFTEADCIEALDQCGYQLDDAALWLTQNAEPKKSYAVLQPTNSPLEVFAVEISAQCISICVIDDCKDADVPLLEFSLSQLDFKQELKGSLLDNIQSSLVAYSATSSGFCKGHLKAVLASDYYNRHLSGWEPMIEPWKCFSSWSYSTETSTNRQSRLNTKIVGEDLLKLNITSTIIELWKTVQTNWTQDYYEGGTAPSYLSSGNRSPSAYRRRSPFVPFSIQNNTGVRLSFKIMITSPGGVAHSDLSSNTVRGQWITVDPNDTVPFSFGEQNKLRHLDTHKLNLHQIVVRLDGWSEIGPISVDKVGTFFRHAYREPFAEFPTMPRSRIVFDVTLEGSAQKLITVRSALRIFNQLEHMILLKMEHAHNYMDVKKWPEPKKAVVGAGDRFSIPLSHVHSFLFFRPVPSSNGTETELNGNMQIGKITDAMLMGNDNWRQLERDNQPLAANINNQFKFCDRSIHWKRCMDNSDIQQELITCTNSRRKTFNVLATIKREAYPNKYMNHMPGHTVVLLPPMRIHNLLCCDLIYKISSCGQGRVQPSATANIFDVNLNDEVNFNIILDGYSESGQLSIQGGHTGYAELKMRLVDVNKRVLYLLASIHVIKGSGMEITISAPYWLVNRTGLPLIFRQEGVSLDAAGQFSEHEQARLLSPLMFSFSDPDASPALVMRLGKRYGNNPSWSQAFSLHEDIIHRQVKTANTNEVFIFGIEVRRGRGRYARTSVVTFSPRFQLYNGSSHKLQFAQKCHAISLADPEAKSSIIEAIPGCHLPFHWPRLDREQMLCVRLPDVEECLWSGAIPINEAHSLYINIRNSFGDMHFLRLEIILQGATYFLLFGDAHALPPPIRMDNYSEVPIKFFQMGCKHQWRTIIRPHSTVSYALDEPMGSLYLQIEPPGGVGHSYSLKNVGMSHNMTYENFIYIAFKGTFFNASTTENFRKVAEYDIETQNLVLGVRDNRVILMHKLPGDRSQLWRMNQDKQLEHEGSSPPTEPGKPPAHIHPRLVLDLERAPQPMQYTSLVVRPANRQRKSTQTWRFTDEGRLMCEHANMCVQARNGLFGLTPGADVVLGMITTEKHGYGGTVVPIDQAIERQKLRPGSGFLSVTISMDGPITAVQIKDIKFNNNGPLTPDPQWRHASHIFANNSPRDNPFAKEQKGFVEEYYVNVNLSKGMGISLISKRPREELAYVTLENIVIESVITPSVRSIDVNLGDVQIDNQLFETPCPVLMYTLKSNSTGETTDLPAVQFTAKMLPSPNENAVIYERIVLSLRPIVVYLEERLLLRLALFLGLDKSQNDSTALADESDFEAQQVATKILAANAKRYYFGDLQIIPIQIRLSVITASKLPQKLGEVKKKLGLTLIKFEDALIEFKKFSYKHHFETLEIYMRAIKSHYKNELKWQAASILGSVDFLGNPLGFANDLSEGVSDLIFEGSVKSLVKNVTHGISNSTAKLTETLSDGLGRVVLDEHDTETRQKILEVPAMANSSGKHLAAGLRGFGFGILGGVTSIVRHTYEGAQNDGIQGFISGLGKGIVGTVTKPLIGVLDLASETANAVRETSKSAHRLLPERKRLPRCVYGTSGLLPAYSYVQSKGQQYLFYINKRAFTEQFMSYEPKLYVSRDSTLRLLASSENIWVFSITESTTTIILTYHLSEVVSCHSVSVNVTAEGHKLRTPHYYIELCLRPKTNMSSSSMQEVVKRPRVRCQTEEMAQKASREINYAKSVYYERDHTLKFDLLLDA